MRPNKAEVANESGEMAVRMRDVIATPGLVLRCVHLAFNALFRLNFKMEGSYSQNFTILNSLQIETVGYGLIHRVKLFALRRTVAWTVEVLSLWVSQTMNKQRTMENKSLLFQQR